MQRSDRRIHSLPLPRLPITYLVRQRLAVRKFNEPQPDFVFRVFRVTPTNGVRREVAGEVDTVMQHATDFEVAISKWQKMTRLPSTRRWSPDSVPTVASLTVSLCSGYEPLRSLLIEKNFSQREGGR